MAYAAYDNGGTGGYEGGGVSFPAILSAFKRQIPLMLLIFFILSALGWYFAGKLKRTYTAEARMIVTLSEDYVYRPIDGSENNQGGGLVMTPDSITLNEIAIMNNPALIDSVIGEIGLSRLFPDDAKEYASAQGLERDNVMHVILEKFESSYAVAARPKSSVIDMRFEHEDPAVAKDTLTALIAAYKTARLDVFKADAKDVIGDRRAATEKQLAAVDREISYFLKTNQIADFESEREGVRERTEDLRAELNALRGSIREAETALATTEDRLRQTPPTIDLYVDDRAAQRVAQAELELKQLLAKYLPTSDPVMAKQREIQELRQLISSYGGAATGGRRVGPNPVYQELATQRNTLQATADSFREKEYVLQSQLNSADGKVAKLTGLSPRYENMLREKKTLEATLETLNAREQIALVEQAQADLNNENVKEINLPGLSRKGRNIKKIVQFLSIIGAALTALMIGMLRVFLDPSIYGPARPRGQSRPQADSYAPSAEYNSYIPDPVQPYVPQEAPAYAPPAYAPAAAVMGAGAMGDGTMGYDSMGYDTSHGYMAGGDIAAHTQYHNAQAYAAQPFEAPAYESAAPQLYAEPMAVAAGQDFAADLSDNPYANGTASTNNQAYVQSADGQSIPIIGHAADPSAGLYN